MVRKVRTLLEDQQLAEEVRKYPCLYDKSDRGYKEKETVVNAWKEIENVLEYDEGTALHLFENLKKRYSKKRHAVMKLSRFGSESDVSAAEIQLKEYDFLVWLNPHIRRKKPNYTESVYDDDDEFSGDNEDNDIKENIETDARDEVIAFIEGDDLNYVSMVSVEPPTRLKRKTTTSQSVDTKKSRNFQTITHYTDTQAGMSENKEKERIESPSSICLNQGLDRPSIQGLDRPSIQGLDRPSIQGLDRPSIQIQSEKTFGSLVADELVRLPSLYRIQAKQEITNILYRYQIQHAEMMSTHVTPSSNSVPHN